MILDYSAELKKTKTAGLSIGGDMSHLPKLCPTEEEAEDASHPPSVQVKERR